MRANTRINKEEVNADLRKLYGNTITRKQLFQYRDKTGVYPVWIRRDESLRISRGVYRIPGADYIPTSTPAIVRAEEAKSAAEAVAAVEFNPTPNIDAEVIAHSPIHQKMKDLREQASLLASVPRKDPAFVPFGDYDMIRAVVSGRQFFPVFITGLSGNGKTFRVEQACAEEGREYVRVNITAETDEDDLIGGFRLVNGNTVFELGPVIVAMLRGAVLLIDEIDYASPKIACIQSVLEGRQVTLKKLGITVVPAPGSTVFATANTKGRGDDAGKFVGANLLNEAFLDRFPVTVEQEYPGVAVEKKILAKNFTAAGFTMTDHARTFFDTLAKWAESIRATYMEGGIEDLVATRRLCHIVKAYGLFGYDDAKALSYCVNRYDPKVKDAFVDLYNKLAPDHAPETRGSLDGDDVTEPAF